MSFRRRAAAVLSGANPWYLNLTNAYQNAAGLVITGVAKSLGQLLVVRDFQLAPIFTVASDGGAGVFGDDSSVYQPGTFTDATWRALGSTHHQLARDVGGMTIGAGASKTVILFGKGAPNATYPINSPQLGYVYVPAFGTAPNPVYRYDTKGWRVGP